MKPDLIISWPRNTDYPLWREMIRENRERFDTVIIAFTETNQGEDYRDFVRQAMEQDWILFVDAMKTPPNEDWRNYAVNLSLLHSYNAPWIFFTEQDFFIKDQQVFWETVEHLAELGCDSIGVKDANRMHPCCLFLKRETLQKTRKNFGIDPGRVDHFGLIQEDLESMGSKYGELQENLYHHMNGLSHNFTLMTRGEEPNYQPELYRNYLTNCLNARVPLDPRFVAAVLSYMPTPPPTFSASDQDLGWSIDGR